MKTKTMRQIDYHHAKIVGSKIFSLLIFCPRFCKRINQFINTNTNINLCSENTNFKFEDFLVTGDFSSACDTIISSYTT